MSFTDPELPRGLTTAEARQPTLPFTPYDRGTSSGHSGSETSEERSLERDSTGKTAKTQRRVFNLVRGLNTGGLTVAELRSILTTEHHGTLSGALSNLHQQGLLARLKERRNRCQVYVAPEFVGGRETVPHGRSKPTLTADEKELVERVRRYAHDFPGGMNPTIPTSKNVLMRLVSIIERLS